tara:strand:- start:4505 stop:4708 length:204 start_codon:yes stop_codon:yes gene_type:complete
MDEHGDSCDCEFCTTTRLLTTDLYKTKATTTLQRRFKAVLKKMAETVASELPSPYEEGNQLYGFWYD